MAKRELHGIFHAPTGHWVGDGFPVRTLFSYDRLGRALSPFLLLDYAGPMDFSAAAKPRGVGEHPHRGFETVTLVYSGEVAHRDSAGNGGVIGPGDVQWMTAGAGVMHEEFHSQGFTSRGGKLEAVQLWVNLPAAKKMIEPRYQGIEAKQIPTVPLISVGVESSNSTSSQVVGEVRVVAGRYLDYQGPARTHSPLNVWDITVDEAVAVNFELPEDFNAVLVVLDAELTLPEGQPVGPADFALFSPGEGPVKFKTQRGGRLLLLSGQPLEEPISGYGPFVMNTREEIVQAFNDLQSGQFGKLHA